MSITFDPRKMSWASLVLVLSAAERLSCTPGEAASRLLDEAASRSLLHTPHPQPEGDDRKAALVA
jgi:hypothetical protein